MTLVGELLFAVNTSYGVYMYSQGHFAIAAFNLGVAAFLLPGLIR